MRRLRNNNAFDFQDVEIRVIDSSVTLTGRVKTYELKREMGKEAWDTKGVVKVLNDLDLTATTTAGP